MSASVSVQYAARVADGKIERDSAQQRIVDRLAQLETELAEQRLARKSSSLGWLFGSLTNGILFAVLNPAPMRVKSRPVLPN